jgi:GT2 family glycosyltransferase
MKNSVVHIVIPVHGRLNYTKKCIESIKSQTYSNCKIYVVDDGSKDDTLSWLSSNKGISVIKGDGQLWWTGAVAKGCKYVLSVAHKDDYLMTLNNDVVLDNKAIELLVFASTDNNSICGSLSVDIDNGICMSSGAIVKSWLFNINHHPFRGENLLSAHKENINVSMLTGRSVLYPLHAIINYGNFDFKSLPHYGGDIEMTVRMGRHHDLLIIPSSIVYVSREQTGLNTDDRHIGILDRLRSLFSIKSANNLYFRTVLAIKIAPRYSIVTYLVVTYLKIFISLFIFKKK